MFLSNQYNAINYFSNQKSKSNNNPNAKTYKLSFNDRSGANQRIATDLFYYQNQTQPTPKKNNESLITKILKMRKKPSNKDSEVRLAMFSFNDIHATTSGLEKIMTASNFFDKQYQNIPKIDLIKVSGGDNTIGSDPDRNEFVIDGLNEIGIDVSAIGNHEFDFKSKNFAHIIDKANYKYVSTNLNVNPNSELNEDIAKGRIVRSHIIEKNGHKYGVVGVTPTELKDKMTEDSKNGCKDITIDNLEQTKIELQKEINKLESQGINKIILSAHMEIEDIAKVAQSVNGIDLIPSGHTHRKLKKIKPGVNYFNAPNGNPVLIMQSGKNGEAFSITDVVFNENGKIIRASNNLISTENIPKSLILKYHEDQIMGKANKIGTITSSVKSGTEEKSLEDEESPLASFVADAIKAKSGAQIVFSNTGGVRGSLDKGEITDRNIEELTPNKNLINLYKFSEKDIMNALNQGIESALNKPHSPGLLQVSGLQYKIDANMQLKEVLLLNPDGTTTKLNHKNPDDNKSFTVAYNTYLASGPKNMDALHCPEKIIDNFNWTNTAATIDYIKSFQNKPIDIKKDGRITVDK